MRWIVLSLVCLATLAGCADKGDETDDYAGSVDGTLSGTFSGSAGNNTVTGGANVTGNGTGNVSGNASAGMQDQWTQENRSGSVEGLNLMVNEEPSAEESFVVSNGTDELVLNVSYEGDDLTVTARPPGCESEDCEVEIPTSGGAGSQSFDQPDEGSWMLVLTAEGVGPQESTYDLTIASRDTPEQPPSAGASGNATTNTTTGP
jgi:hypothetical protein